MGFSGDLLAFPIKWPADFHNTLFGEMTDADKIMNQRFWCNPADLRIRIRINPEIRIQTPDNFWLRLNDLVEMCTLGKLECAQFLSRVSILTRDIDIANPSVCLSVTFRYQMKTA